MNLQNRWLVLAIVSSALLLITLDMTVLYTALPTLTRELDASASERLWILNAYPLVMAGLLPGLGTLGDRLGHKRLFIAGLLVFGTASLIAAFSPVPAVLIAARVLLAVGAAMMMPATLSIIRLTFEDERERALAIGIWAAVAAGGAALGPVLGGLLLTWFWWGSVFLINVPVVLLALLLGSTLIANRPGNPERQWDLLGSLQILVGLTALAYAIKEMGRRGMVWDQVLLALVLGCLSLWLFARRQKRRVDPLIDFKLFRNPPFAFGVLSAIIAAFVLIGIELVLMQHMQLVRGMTPLQAGLFILPVGLAAFVAGPLAGWMLPRLGATGLLWQSMLLACAGVVLLVLKGGVLVQMIGFICFGLGLGAVMTVASSVIMLTAPPDRAGMAASVEEVSYELGGALGIALLGSILTAAYGFSLNLPGDLQLPAQVYDSLDEALMVADHLGGATAELLREQARLAFDRAFVVVGWIAALVLLVTAWLVRKKLRPV